MSTDNIIFNDEQGVVDSTDVVLTVSLELERDSRRYNRPFSEQQEVSIG